MEVVKSTLAYPLLFSVGTSAYLREHELRGDVFLLCIFAAHTALMFWKYTLSGSFLESFTHATEQVSLYLLFLTLETVVYRLSPLHPLASFPGPIANKITSLELARAVATGKRRHYTNDLHTKYGPIVRIGPNTLSVNSLDAVHPLYASAQAFDKSQDYRPGRNADSLFFIRDKVTHAHRRRVWAGAFVPAAIKDNEPALNERTEQLVTCIARRQNSSGTVNLQHCLDHWAMDIMGDLTFGGSNRIEFMEEGDPEGVIQSGQNSIIVYDILGQVPALFDVCSWLPITDEYSKMEKLAARLLAKRREVASKNNWDMCSFFLAQRENHPYPALEGDVLLADTILAITAGSDTVAAVMTIMFFYLLDNRAAYDRLVAELQDAFPTGEVTPDDHVKLLELPYLSAVINEGLRFAVAFPGMPRVVPPGGVVLEGRHIPAGTIVSVPTWGQQMSPQNFSPATLEFKPERWLKDGLGPDTVTRKEALMAFQFGPFGCLGKALALRQMSVLLAHLLLAYDITFPPEFEPKAFVDGWSNNRTNVLRYPLMVKAVRRKT